MIPALSRHLRLASICALLLATVTSHARVTRIEFSERTDANARQGVPESYRVLRGHITGELSPDDIHNRVIQDIALASRNPRSMVEYTTTFTLYQPLHPNPQAALIYEVVNRGASIMPRSMRTETTSLSQAGKETFPLTVRQSMAATARRFVSPQLATRTATRSPAPSLHDFSTSHKGKRRLLYVNLQHTPRRVWPLRLTHWTPKMLN